MTQVTPNTDAVQDRHVESLMLSGSRFVSSILPPGSHLIAAAAIPVFYRDPVITGPEVIGEAYAPPLLTCEAESHRSSPRGVLTYQWKRDTVVIAGATSITYATVAADVGTTITCTATATNPSGSANATSNGIAVVARTPTYLYEFDVMGIQGLSQPDRVDNNSVYMYMVSGIANADKLDNNEMDVYAMSGHPQPDAMAVSTSDVYAMTGHPQPDAIASFGNEVYAVVQPTFLDDLVVVNGDAENSVMTDWTMDSGNVTSVTSATGASTDGREGLRFFKADDLGQGVDSQMSQEITIPGGDLTDIDTGRCYAAVQIMHDSYTGHDHIEITLEALNAASSVIGTSTHVFPSNPQYNSDWAHANSIDDALSIPTLTRSINVIVLFAASNSGSAANNAYLDDIQLNLMKIA